MLRNMAIVWMAIIMVEQPSCCRNGSRMGWAMFWMYMALRLSYRTKRPSIHFCVMRHVCTGVFQHTELYRITYHHLKLWHIWYLGMSAIMSQNGIFLQSAAILFSVSVFNCWKLTLYISKPTCDKMQYLNGFRIMQQS